MVRSCSTGVQHEKKQSCENGYNTGPLNEKRCGRTRHKMSTFTFERCEKNFMKLESTIIHINKEKIGP